MRALLKSSFVWQFAGGFALGAIGLFTFHPATATPVTPAPTYVAASAVSSR